MQGIEMTLLEISRRALITVTILCLLAACQPAPVTQAPNPGGPTSTPPPVTQTPVSTITPTLTPGIGVLGDSNSDEYRADDQRGGNYGETTFNWVEQLAKTRGLNFGTWGSWGEPRRTGYEYNWARSGATVDSMITMGQHTGLAKQVAEGKVSVVVIWIGTNDFHIHNGSYEEIYSGKLRDSDLQQKVDQAAQGIITAMDTILQAGPVKMGVVTIPDQGIVPEAKLLFPNSEKRQRVTNAIQTINARVKEFADANGVILLDSTAFGSRVLSNVDLLGNYEMSGQKFSVLIRGDEPHHLQLGDGPGHAGTVVSGMIANSLFIEPFNSAFGLDIKPLTDEEILKNAGLE